MANSITAATALVQDSIEALKPFTAPLGIFSHNFSEEAKSPNETILVPVIASGTAVRKETTDDVDFLTEATGSTKTVEVKLKRFFRSAVFSTRDFNLLGDKGIAKHAADLITSVYEQKSDYALSLLNTAAAVQNVTTTGTITYADIVNLKLACTKKKIAARESVLLQSPEAVAKTMLVEEFSKAYGLSLASAQNGEISNLLGFPAYEVTGVPTDTFSIAAHRSALAMASRATGSSGADDEQTILGPDNAPITLRVVPIPEKDKILLIVDTLFGATALENRAVKLLATQA